MTFTKSLIAAGMLAALSGSAAAQSFYICPPISTDCTTSIDELGVDANATSYYASSGTNSSDTVVSVGDTVVDAGTGTTTLLFNGTSLSSNDGLFFQTGGPARNDDWTLTVEYDYLAQTVAAVTGAAGDGDRPVVLGNVDAANSQPIEIYYSDFGGSYSSPTLLAKLLPVSGTADGTSIFLTLEVSFDGVVDTALADGFFTFDGDTDDWYTLWANDAGSTDLLIQGVFDYNINSQTGSATPLSYDATGSYDAGTPGDTSDDFAYTLSRTTNLNGSVSFSIPEPTTIALMGAGLLGAGFAARRRNAKP